MGSEVDLSEYGYTIESPTGKPIWLRDDDEFIFKDDENVWIYGYSYSWNKPTIFRLKKYHLWYVFDQYRIRHIKALSYWKGANRIPEDWDRGPVLFANGTMGEAQDFQWEHYAEDDDIIGYSAKVIELYPDHDTPSAPQPEEGTWWEYRIGDLLTDKEKILVDRLITSGLDPASDLLSKVIWMLRDRNIAVEKLKTISEENDEVDIRWSRKEALLTLLRISQKSSI